MASKRKDQGAKAQTNTQPAKAGTGAPAAAAGTETPAPAAAAPNVPGTVQYTDSQGAKHVAYVNRRHGNGVFDLAFHVGNEKRFANSIAQGIAPGTWQLLPEEKPSKAAD